MNIWKCFYNGIGIEVTIDSLFTARVHAVERKQGMYPVQVFMSVWQLRPSESPLRTNNYKELIL
jgi:hypothetical protein